MLETLRQPDDIYDTPSPGRYLTKILSFTKIENIAEPGPSELEHIAL